MTDEYYISTTKINKLYRRELRDLYRHWLFYSVLFNAFFLFVIFGFLYAVNNNSLFQDIRWWYGVGAVLYLPIVWLSYFSKWSSSREFRKRAHEDVLNGLLEVWTFSIHNAIIFYERGSEGDCYLFEDQYKRVWLLFGQKTSNDLHRYGFPKTELCMFFSPRAKHFFGCRVKGEKVKLIEACVPFVATPWFSKSDRPPLVSISASFDEVLQVIIDCRGK